MPYISALSVFSAFSRRSETCDFSSVSVNSRGIKTPRSLRSLREIYNHHTDVLFPFVSRFQFVFAYLP